MTFDQLVVEIMDRMNLSSAEAETRVGRAINRKYRLITSSIGLELSRRGTVQQVVTPGVSLVTFSNVEKIINIQDRTTSPYRTLSELSLDELELERPFSAADAPSKWASASHTSDTFTVLINRVPQTAFTLYADAHQVVADLFGSNEPAFPESFHDVIIEGVLADEYRKMEKTQLSMLSQKEFDRILSDLRMWIAKSGWKDIYQGKANNVLTGGGTSATGSSSFNGAQSWTQTGLITFDRDPGPPFAVTPGSSVVDNLISEFAGDGTVQVIPGTGVGRVFAPDGTEVSTAGTTTYGLQEAFNYAFTNGFDVHVAGGPDFIYFVNAGVTLNVPVLEESSHWIIDASINFNGSGSDVTTCLQFDSMMSSVFEWNGRIISGRGGSIVVFKPQTALSTAGGIKVITASKIYLAVIAGTPDGACAATEAIKFDTTGVGNLGFINNFLDCNEINGATSAVVSVPTVSAGSNFYQNIIRAAYIHGMVGTAWAVQLGTANPVGLAHDNIWNVDIRGAGTNRGIRTWHARDQWVCNIVIDAAAVALNLEANANLNRFEMGEIVGTVTNSAATDNNTIVQGSNINRLGRFAVGAITTPNYGAQLHCPAGINSILQFTNATTGSGAGDGGFVGITDASNVMRVTNLENAALDFYTNNTRRVRIEAAGDVTLDIGQLNFPAAQNASSGANTLDDYEEGTFTPTLGGDGGGSGSADTFATQNGIYVKIGRFVFCTVSLVLSAKNRTYTGVVVVQGLPFTAQNTAYPGGGTVYEFVSLPTNFASIGVRVLNNNTIAYLMGVAAGGAGSSVGLVNADIDSNTGLNLTFTYEATA